MFVVVVQKNKKNNTNNNNNTTDEATTVKKIMEEEVPCFPRPRLPPLQSFRYHYFKITHFPLTPLVFARQNDIPTPFQHPFQCTRGPVTSSEQEAPSASVNDQFIHIPTSLRYANFKNNHLPSPHLTFPRLNDNSTREVENEVKTRSRPAPTQAPPTPSKSMKNLIIHISFILLITVTATHQSVLGNNKIHQFTQTEHQKPNELIYPPPTPSAKFRARRRHQAQIRQNLGRFIFSLILTYHGTAPDIPRKRAIYGSLAGNLSP